MCPYTANYVSAYNHGELRIGTLQSIIRQSGYESALCNLLSGNPARHAACLKLNHKDLTT